MMHRKACTECGEVKTLDEYHRDKQMRDGRRPDCKECVKEKKRRYREENREQERERGRRYREENREEIREKNRRYYEENREKILEQKRRYQEENQEVILAQKRQHEKARQSRTNAFADNKGRPWSLDEEVFLMEGNGMTIYQKAIYLGRTYRSVSSKAIKLRSRPLSPTNPAP